MLCVGRWNGAVVAVKVVEHPMTSTAAVLAGGRESLLATSVAHPNVVRAVHQTTSAFAIRGGRGSSAEEGGGCIGGFTHRARHTGHDIIQSVSKQLMLMSRRLGRLESQL